MTISNPSRNAARATEVLRDRRNRTGRITLDTLQRRAVMIRKLTLAGCAIAALSIAACDQRETGAASDQQNQAANTVQDEAAGVVGAAAGPAAATTVEGFVTNAAIGGLYEVEAGRIAAQRSQNPRIKALGEAMVTDHTKAGEALKPIAAELSIRVPTVLDERHRGLIDNLRGATDQDFDRVYLQQQEAAHNETALLLSTYGELGNNTALKAWAAQTLPVVEGHKRMIDQLDEANADAPN
jgi:putative membrane protein